MSSRTRPVTSGEVRSRSNLVDVQIELAREADDVGGSLVLLVGEQAALEFEELALQGCRLRRLRAGQRVGVVRGQRRVAPHVAQVVAELVLHLLDRPRGLQAESALEVAVLDDRVRRIGTAEHVIALVVHRAGEGLTRVLVGAEGIRDAEDERRDQERDDGCREHAHPRLVLRGGVVDRQVDDEERDREADAAEGCASGDAVEGETRSELADAQDAKDRRGAEHPDELADDQAHDDAPREGRGHRAGEDLGVDHDARVGEGEQREDHIGDVRGVCGLQALVDRDRLAQAVRRRAGRIRCSATAGRCARGRARARRRVDRGGTPARAGRSRHRPGSGARPRRGRPATRSPRGSRTPDRVRRGGTA